MKKNSLILLVSLLSVFLLIFSGCSNQPEKSAQEEQSAAEIDKSPMNLTFIGASATGPGLIIMNGLAECVSKSYPDSVVTIVPGNFGTNVTRMNNSEADAAITDSAFVKAAIDGKEPFDQKMDNLAGIAYLYSSSLHLIADKNLGIDSFDEIIKNKMKLRISVGLAGGSSDKYFTQLLAEYDLTKDDYNKWGGEILYQDIATGVQMMTDNRIDAMVMGSFVPTPNVQELSKNKDIVLLKIEPKIIDSMCAKYGYNKSSFPAGSYSFVNEDLDCINSNTIFITPKNSSEENVYQITRSICENHEYLQTVHSSLAKTAAGDFVNKLDIPLHPGAEKYYREAGIIK
ncbi:MAG TPA: TAXI family TRAP transporter solute-binding subunit [Syntrophomonadaceae bacterium]|nr:TAXI family TRAP transporter solute-binding subunit [Syntrophomonadaceae bacterium]HNX29320.1 TAXI family TRAP transporter solute-binding subunit [Syntrophomonadaceae bacterium]HPR93016.1 TAXI family TRAP transporter solute-binding subunit [Syntrophomonadaceae bacterium]